MISTSNSAYTEYVLDQLFYKVFKEFLDEEGREECVSYDKSTVDFYKEIVKIGSLATGFPAQEIKPLFLRD